MRQLVAPTIHFVVAYAMTVVFFAAFVGLPVGLIDYAVNGDFARRVTHCVVFFAGVGMLIGVFWAVEVVGRIAENEIRAAKVADAAD